MTTWIYEGGFGEDVYYDQEDIYYDAGWYYDGGDVITQWIEEDL